LSRCRSVLSGHNTTRDWEGRGGQITTVQPAACINWSYAIRATGVRYRIILHLNQYVINHCWQEVTTLLTLLEFQLTKIIERIYRIYSKLCCHFPHATFNIM
jgi:hypothetical protein